MKVFLVCLFRVLTAGASKLKKAIVTVYNLPWKRIGKTTIEVLEFIVLILALREAWVHYYPDLVATWGSLLDEILSMVQQMRSMQ